MRLVAAAFDWMCTAKLGENATPQERELFEATADLRSELELAGRPVNGGPHLHTIAHTRGAYDC